MEELNFEMEGDDTDTEVRQDHGAEEGGMTGDHESRGK